MLSLPVSLGDPSGIWFHGPSHSSYQGGFLPHTHPPFPTQTILPLPRCYGQNSELGLNLLCDLRLPSASLWACSLAP